MANHQRCFFYTPTWEFPPGGAIKLGNVITSVDEPEYALHCAPPPSSSEGWDVFSTTKTDVQYTEEKLRTGQFSMWTRFLSMLNIDVGARVDDRAAGAFSFKTIETTQFVPTPDYLTECMQSARVQDYLEITDYNKPIYIVTGLKVVTGAEANTPRSRSSGASAGLDVDTALLNGGAVPTATRVWAGSSDFVFAFCVVKVRVSATQEVDMGQYRDGAMLGHDENAPVKASKLTIVEAQDLVAAEGKGFETVELMENGHAVVCVIQKDKTDKKKARTRLSIDY